MHARFALALATIIAPIACRPPTRSPVSAHVGDSSADSAATYGDASSARDEPAVISAPSTTPYDTIAAPSWLFREAIARAAERLRAEGSRFRVRVINDPRGAETQQFIDLTSLAQRAPDESLRERCGDDPSSALPTATRDAALRAFVRTTSVARRLRAQDPDELAAIERTFTQGSVDLHVGCASRRGNALIFGVIDDTHTVALRKTTSAVTLIANSALRETVALEGVWRVEDDAFRGDFTGDSANEAVVVLREHEGPHWMLELYSADAPRATRLTLDPQECSADCDGESQRLDCRPSALPAITALWDSDRWVLRVGLHTFRSSDDGAALNAAPPRDRALAAWLDRVSEQERGLTELARALSHTQEALASQRTSIHRALLSLGETEADAHRAVERLLSH